MNNNKIVRLVMGLASSKGNNNQLSLSWSECDNFILHVRNYGSLPQKFLLKYFKIKTDRNGNILYEALIDNPKMRKMLYRAMHVAIRRYRIAVIQELLQIDILDINSREYGDSLLDIAASKVKYTNAYELLKKHDQRQKALQARTVVSQPIETTNAAMPSRSTANDISSVKVVSSLAKHATFLEAIVAGDLQGVQYYLQYQVTSVEDLVITTAHGDTALHLAIYGGHAPIVSALLNYVAPKNLQISYPYFDVNQINYAGVSPLFAAMMNRHGHRNTILKLIATNPRVSETCMSNAKQLFYKAYNGNLLGNVKSEYHAVADFLNGKALMTESVDEVDYSNSDQLATSAQAENTPHTQNVAISAPVATMIIIPDDVTPDSFCNGEPIPNDYLDHIAGDGRVMQNPVMTFTGHSYDSNSLRRHLASRINANLWLSDPLTNEPLRRLNGELLRYKDVLKTTLTDFGTEKQEIDLKEFIPNHTLKSAIDTFIETAKKGKTSEDAEDYQQSVSLLQSSMNEYHLNKMRKMQARYELAEAQRRSLIPPAVNSSSSSSSSSSSTAIAHHAYSPFWERADTTTTRRDEQNVNETSHEHKSNYP